jgi:bacterioferritin-associated ferredoxin
MENNVLNKQFEKRDVERLRNLVTGKYGDKTILSVGYNKKHESYTEGDIWEEDGRKWTIKNGIKQNITKFDEIKKLHVLPLVCPKCFKLMKTHIDKPFYNIHKMCLNCVAEFETKIKVEGKWEEYENSIHNQEIDNLIKEFTEWTLSEIKVKNKSFITENGKVENWVGGSNEEQIKLNLQESIKYLESLKR